MSGWPKHGLRMSLKTKPSNVTKHRSPNLSRDASRCACAGQERRIMITHPATGERTRESLYRSWSELRARYPSISARDAALTLGASEAQLAAARCTCGEGTALAAAPAALLSAVAALGPVTARTASHGAVLDNVGTYGAPDIGEHTGIVIGDGIDLRIFPRGWAFAYALSDTAESDVQRSVQIFDAAGEASHTIYLRPDSDIQAYEMLVNALASTEIAEPVLRADGPLPVETADDAIDRDAYRQAFAAMTDTHDFFMLLHRFGLTREQGVAAGRTGVCARRRPQRASSVVPLRGRGKHSADDLRC